MESMVKKLKQKCISSRKKYEEKMFLENGSNFLKELIADCNGKSIPIRNFSSSQILKATNNFDSSCLFSTLLWGVYWYKGIIEDKPYLIKKFYNYGDDGEIFNDIVFSAKMSNHNNFLKLIGCCFEFHLPVVVFEYVDHAFMNKVRSIMDLFNRDEYILPWNVRLKIAKEVAVAVTYLHTAFPRIIIHRGIRPSNIFVNKNLTAKLTDFTISISLPEGKSRSQDEKIIGTYGYMDPLYIATSSLSEYTDVYSFGVCLLVFLTGRTPYSFSEEHRPFEEPHLIITFTKGLHKNGKLGEVIDPKIAKDITSSQKLQVEAFVVLALRCCEKSEEDRPKMIQVAKELKRIERLEKSLDASSAAI